MVRSLCGVMLVVWLLSFWVHAQAQTLAFPSAEGFGRFAQGGRGGTVMQVTNLNTSGPGSLRACLEATGPRTCIFRVGGIIDWPIETPTINPYVTIAGQTAPGDGIILKSMQLQFNQTHDVIVRHIRVRPGANVPVPASWGCIEMANAHDIIIDHASMGWSTDDCSGGQFSYNITYQWSIISDGLGHGPGDPSKVMLWDYTGSSYTGTDNGISILHNLMMDHNYRVPSISAGSAQLVNNVIYNNYLGSQVYPTRSPIKAGFVNNYYLQGPNTYKGNAFGNAITALGCGYDSYVDCGYANASQIYLSGNFHNTLRPNNSYAETSLLAQQAQAIPVVATPFSFFPTIPSQTDAQQAKTDVLAKAGARVPLSDSIDQRALANFNNGTGQRDLGTESVLGSYPPYNSGTPYTDTDGDGMSDAWEIAHGLNPNDPSDGPRMAANGYTNLENFLNELAGDNVLGTSILAPRLRVLSVTP